MKGRVLYILILFDILARFSVSSLQLIELEAVWDENSVEIMEYQPIRLMENKPFTIIVHSDKPVTKIELQLAEDLTTIRLENYGSFYAPPGLMVVNGEITDIVSSVPCKLFGKSQDEIEFKIDMIFINDNSPEANMSLSVSKEKVTLEEKTVDLTVHGQLHINIFSEEGYKDIRMQCFDKETRDVIFEVVGKSWFADDSLLKHNFYKTVVLHDVINTTATCELHVNSSEHKFEIEIIVRKPEYSLKDMVIYENNRNSLKPAKNNFVLVQNEPYSIIVSSLYNEYTKLQCKNNLSGELIIEENLSEASYSRTDYAPMRLVVPHKVMDTSLLLCELHKEGDEINTFKINLAVRATANPDDILELMARWDKKTVKALEELDLTLSESFLIRVYSHKPVKKIKCKTTKDLNFFKNIDLEDNGDYYAPKNLIVPQNAMKNTTLACDLYEKDTPSSNSISFKLNIAVKEPNKDNRSNIAVKEPNKDNITYIAVKEPNRGSASSVVLSPLFIYILFVYLVCK